MVVVIVFRFFLSSALNVLGAFFGFMGCWVFVNSSYPSAIVSSCFYSNASIQPPPGSWWFRVHLGTRVLRGGQLQLIGSILYAAASAVWIQEDYQYKSKSDESSPPTGEYFMVVGGFFMLVSGCYYQLLGQYPQSVVHRSGRRRNRASSADATGLGPSELLANHLGTDIQVSGWFLEILSLVWLLRSAIQFDDSTTLPGEYESSEEVSAPFSDFDWRAFFHCAVSFAMAFGAYFLLAQAYREGTRMDAVLIEQARLVRDADDVEVGNAHASVHTPPTSSNIVHPHPLADLPELTDSKAVLRRARKLVSDPVWSPTPTSLPQLSVWTHTSAHAVRFETARFANVNPLLLAAIMQSEQFKKFQLANSIGSSVSVIGKLPLLGGSMGTLFFEKFPPNPPMPAHESSFVSLLHETRNRVEDVAEVIEWAVGNARYAGAPNVGSAHIVRVAPFRYVSVSSDGRLGVLVWLEEIARWMPDFLLKAEMSKVPLVVRELAAFLAQPNLVAQVADSLNVWIWQKVHNSISPLSAAVLVRTAPSYRVLLTNHAGLRTRVPESVSVAAGSMAHPLTHFPKQLEDDPQLNVPVLVKHGSDFVSNEFGAWHLSDEYRPKPGRAKISVWRQDLEGESVRPFRLQARIHGIDPLTLAVMIHRNKLDQLVEMGDRRKSLARSPFASQMSGNDPLQSRRSSRTPEPLRSQTSNPFQSSVGDPVSHEHITVSSLLKGTFQEGAVRVYTDRKRRTKFVPTARDREFTFGSIMKDVTPLKAVVVHFGLTLDEGRGAHLDPDIVHLRKFQAWSLENDGGTDTKLTWAGLVPVGGRMEKVSAFLSSGSELKDKFKFMDRLVNLFTSDANAKNAIAETHAFIAYSAIRSAVQKELKRLSVTYLAEHSEDYKALLSEIQPLSSDESLMGFEDDIRQQRRDAQERKLRQQLEREEASSGSAVTIPLSPVPSHLRLATDDDDEEDEVRTQRNEELDEHEDLIPNERDTR